MNPLGRALPLAVLLAAPCLQALPGHQEGFDAPKLQALLDGLMDGRDNLHSVLVERHGRLVAERYRAGKDKSVYSLFATTRAYGPEDLHDTRSVGKSVLSLLLGIAQGEGRFRGLDTPVLEWFPEHADLATPARRAITLEHLLTMSSGFQWQEGGPGRDDEHRLYWKWTPSRFVLDRPVVASPGSRFTYNSGGTALLAELLERSTGMPLKTYVRKVLFEPLGIRDWAWVGDLHGRPMAFTGLRMRPRDMVKLGRLVLNRGRWGDRQIVPAGWIDASMRPRVTTNFDGLGYGYHWWTGTCPWQGGEVRWSAAFGNGGQRIFVVPDLDLVLVVTGGAYGDIRVARRLNGVLRDLVGALPAR